MTKLSRRLAAVCELAGGGGPVADVGCDHALVPIALVGDGLAPCAVASDLRPGPLAAARANVDAAGLTGRVDVTLCDGVPPDLAVRLAAGARAAGALTPAARIPGVTLITAGMGGLLIRDIYARAANLDLFDFFVASPQRDAGAYRRYIREIGLRIVDERFIEEDGKYYPVIRSERPACAGAIGAPSVQVSVPDIAVEARPASAAAVRPQAASPAATAPVRPSTACRDLFGPVLLSRRDPVLRRYLERRSTYLAQMTEKLRGSEKHAARFLELQEELQLVEEARSCCRGDEEETSCRLL